MEYLLNVKVLGPIITILLIMILYKIVIKVIKKMFSFKSKKIKSIVAVMETGDSRCLIGARSAQLLCEQTDLTIVRQWVEPPFRLLNGEWAAID